MARVLARYEDSLAPAGLRAWCMSELRSTSLWSLPVVMVYRPNSRSLAVSPGKGLDLAAAKGDAARV